MAPSFGGSSKKKAASVGTQGFAYAAIETGCSEECQSVSVKTSDDYSPCSQPECHPKKNLNQNCPAALLLNS